MIKKLTIITLIAVTASFAQTVDTTKKSKSNSTTTTSNVTIAISNGLKKQQKVDGGTTTWSKIKDLFN